ncbi:hypothetical protein [Mucilaginibacter sp. dw_454]|uniref:hypothetical protein n=1 Tax=Mucilaginibacter sp. dw_454 TaxID=2720079 RepID=UPI001BD51D81|nr:hypothetical protein [Mucilaginibacter sp. dw_454]
MKTITVPGDPRSVNSLMVNKSEKFHDHEYVLIQSSDGSQSIEKRIFRVVDAGDGNWELQFE